ncbi:hypothetical protein C0R01_31395 [Streptomyces albidoflavus]|uniref:Uncharacterized protein n=1 Tax=Streptomyces albidoflavus TaxID=1886 RepID=A0A8G2DZT6_9ACTN|nr:hypothetical protein C3K23_00600 [Streptomyces sp. 604F]RZE15436.1 hypothetical protein C0Q92_30755 [Streptomyces albidoflavus]RZE60433.1 hypothetical protein C0R00_22900 [Streptomyces albidoflavus]RZE66025.1 hypothetical protein C0R01_31395 [Streptomyces albidoflavus]
MLKRIEQGWTHAGMAYVLGTSGPPDGRLLGIELFSARRRLHPELLSSADRIDGEPRQPSV